jgi:hypothetical protein
LQFLFVNGNLPTVVRVDEVHDPDRAPPVGRLVHLQFPGTSSLDPRPERRRGRIQVAPPAGLTHYLRRLVQISKAPPLTFW